MNGEIEAIVTYSILAAMLFSYTFLSLIHI